jgi:hypothetical protein
MREVLQVSGEFFIRRELPLEPLGGCGRIAGIALLLLRPEPVLYLDQKVAYLPFVLDVWLAT